MQVTANRSMEQPDFWNEGNPPHQNMPHSRGGRETKDNLKIIVIVHQLRPPPCLKRDSFVSNLARQTLVEDHVRPRHIVPPNAGG